MKKRQIEAITAQLRSNHPFETIDRFILVSNKNNAVCGIKYFSAKENVIDADDESLPEAVRTFITVAMNTLSGRPISLAKDTMEWMVEDFYEVAI